jgi:glucokinase
VILAGDVGGTKTNLGLFEMAGGVPRLVARATFASLEFSGLVPVVEAFLGQLAPGIAATAAGGAGPDRRQAEVDRASSPPALAAACFGVAGPVIDNRTSTPNLAWEIDGRAVATALGLPAVRLINDLVATAEGLALLQADELFTLQAGAGDRGAADPASGLHPAAAAAAAPGAAEAPGNQVLIAAGTGLGMALLPVVGGVRTTVPSEGGHADYAPRDEDEAALLLYLRRRFGEHVSTERVVSGPGLRVIYEHLRDAGHAPESAEVAAALAAGDPSRVIAEAALAGGDPLCSRALDMFIAAYGAAAGNLALIGTATGGVYIGGGIAPKILPRLAGGLFIRAFLDKGRFAAYLERVPVRVVLNDRTALMGAARCAAAALPAAAARGAKRSAPSGPRG